MFRIRRVYDDVLPVNKNSLEQVRTILEARFDQIPAHEVENLSQKLRNPFKLGFRTILLVAEGRRREVEGFSLLFHEPVLHFLFLDFLAAGVGKSSRGIGGALYESVRQEALALDCQAVFFECLPDDDPNLSPEARKMNAARLRFYERFGARPVVGTEYELPLGNDPAPHLVVDQLDRSEPPSGVWARKVVRAILERKYSQLCSPAYVQRVVRSFADGPLTLRSPRYVKSGVTHSAVQPRRELVAVFVNDRHEIHHIRERGYVESPVRIRRILEALDATDWFEKKRYRERSLAHINAVHDPVLVSYLKRACEDVGDKSLYPYVFPVRNKARRPKERSVLAGYFCIDTFTPIHKNAFRAAKGAVDCTLAAADELLLGRRVTYSLVRPPGHHAEKECFGGFCYFNNSAVAAHYLCSHGKVAILDIDYHHGNGQQQIFFQRADVLTLSIHGNPSFAYPYFSGFAEEVGEGPGEGFNVNYPLPERLKGQEYRRTLRQASQRIASFDPQFLVVSLGLDPAKSDPTGTWELEGEDFRKNGQVIGSLGYPTLVVQEGGYRIGKLGSNALAFFQGLLEAIPR